MGVEDGADVGGHALSHVVTRGVSLGILLEMELAASPRNGRENGGVGGLEDAMGIADDEAEAVETTRLKGSQELSASGLRPR